MCRAGAQALGTRATPGRWLWWLSLSAISRRAAAAAQYSGRIWQQGARGMGSQLLLYMDNFPYYCPLYYHNGSAWGESPLFLPTVILLKFWQIQLIPANASWINILRCEKPLVPLDKDRWQGQIRQWVSHDQIWRADCNNVTEELNGPSAMMGPMGEGGVSPHKEPLPPNLDEWTKTSPGVKWQKQWFASGEDSMSSKDSRATMSTKNVILLGKWSQFDTKLNYLYGGHKEGLLTELGAKRSI